MSNTCERLDICNVSPVRPKMKYTSTPMRTRRKTARREHGVDVHTASSSTAQYSPRLQCNSQNSPQFSSTNFNSPSSSVPCSQDNRPDVVWDFTSPKLPKGSKKNELKITVQELLENLNQCQTPECNSQSGPYIKLLESWMSKQPVEIPVKKTNVRDNKKVLKNRSRKRIEELTKFIASIQRPPETNTESKLRLQDNHENKQSESGGEKSNTSFKNSFLEGGSTDDSSEELWGDMDNSFIVKATQELDKITVISTSTSHKASGIISTIPATIPIERVSTVPNECVPLPNELVPTVHNERVSTVSKSMSPVIDKRTCEEHSELLLQLTSIDWDDADDEWDNGFLVEDDDLSLIPEDVLSGKIEEKENMPDSRTYDLQNEIVSESKTFSATDEVKEHESLGETEFLNMVQNIPSAELFNSFEDDSFEDESLLCQPDVLSRIDEVESLLSQPKCTPEEIEKKKDEAIRRRKSTHFEKKT